ncbi:bacteriorhodopsin [Imhoffiella purpurea]|uniref:Rhodopsin n=1 Tax=Imhoffiella purpurea TaxID=1249627 RepID=W9V5U5_9GAMM|nr:bacteriorhodopsin [Imhoffiella purpurea]EXJ14739.1 rhodopsin [Imhoffiella purpurea]
MTTLFNLTYYSFLVCGVAAAVAVLYFMTQVPHLEGRLRYLAFLNILICGVSSVLHLYFFNSLHTLASASPDLAEMAAAIGQLPLTVRYGYWLVTTAMLILMFPLLIGPEHVGVRFAVQLVLIDAGMILTGYLGEHSAQGGDGVTLATFAWFALSGMLWLAMTASILRVLRRLPSDRLIPAQRDALVYMFFFFLIGWAIFPAGFFYAIVFETGIGVVLRELTVNIGDIVNKVIWGILVVYAAREIVNASRRERTH